MMDLTQLFNLAAVLSFLAFSIGALLSVVMCVFYAVMYMAKKMVNPQLHDET